MRRKSWTSWKSFPACGICQVVQSLDYPTVQVDVDREKAGTVYVTPSDVAKSLNEATSSSRFTVPNYWADPKTGIGYQVQVEVPRPVVRSPKGIKPLGSIDDLKMVPVKHNAAGQVLVRDVATVSTGTMPGEIDRYNMKRQVSMTANIAGTDLGSDLAAGGRGAAPRGRPAPRRQSRSPRADSRRCATCSAGWRSGLLLAILVIFLLLAANFQSLRLALVTVSTAPAVIAGVVVMLYLTGTTLNIQSLIGAIMAVGVAMANAILLVTFAENHRRQGEAAADAAVVGRGRPVAPDLDDDLRDDGGDAADGPRLGRVRPAECALGPGGARRTGGRHGRYLVHPSLGVRHRTDRRDDRVGVARSRRSRKRFVPSFRGSRRLPRMNRISLSTLGLPLAFAVLGYVSGCHWSSADPRQAAAPVRVTAAPPVRKTMVRATVQPGQIQAFEQTPLFVKLPGYVQKLYCDMGDRLEEDKPVADLWIPELHDELRQKEAMVASAKAGIRQATTAVLAAQKAVATADALLREARAGTIRASGQYERWKSEHARIVELEASRSVDRRLVDETQNELSAAEAARGEADAKVASAEAALAERKISIEKAEADLAVAQAGVGNAEADLARTRSLLGYTQVRMPYAGTVVERNVNRGDYVQPASMATARPLFVVARSDIVRIFVDVPEMEAAQVEVGATGTIHVQALPGKTIEGTVTRTSWALGANRTLRTELDIPNPQRLLRPGMYASAEIVLQQRPNVLVLPLAAVITVDKQVFCCCVEDNQVVRRPITLGLRTAQDVEIVDGLKGGELVVQTQPASLQAGQRVEVARPE